MVLPPLYFADKGLPLSSTGETTRNLPPELLATILNGHFSYGDFARLACVQTAWQHVLYDACHATPQTQWELACALLDGTHGLAPNPVQAQKVLTELAGVSLNETTPHATTPLHEYSARAMKKLALLYLTRTLDEESSQTTGLAWLQAAYTLGQDQDAAHDMALLYEYGQYDIPVDVVAAAEWFHKAAAAGHTEAMAELGLCYELGCGVEANDETALEWYMKAAECGHVTSKYSVAEAFEEARGVPQSDVEACLWYYRAAMAGDQDSFRALRRLQDIARIAVPGVGVLLDG